MIGVSAFGSVQCSGTVSLVHCWMSSGSLKTCASHPQKFYFGATGATLSNGRNEGQLNDKWK